MRRPWAKELKHSLLASVWYDCQLGVLKGNNVIDKQGGPRIDRAERSTRSIELIIGFEVKPPEDGAQQQPMIKKGPPQLSAKAEGAARDILQQSRPSRPKQSL